MKKINRLLLPLCALFFTLHTSAQSNAGTLKDIAFIQGHWKASNPDRTIEGSWMAPDGNNMMGMMRMMRDGKSTLYEILVYEQSADGLISLVKHFQPGLISVEEKDKQDRYRFLESSPNRAIFQKEGEALRILYEKRSENQFVIARGNQQNGEWVYRDLFVFNRMP
jgi:hypothetical protein